MNTQTTTTTSNAPYSICDMIGNSTDYAYFAPGGAYNGYFEEVLKEAEKEEDLLYCFINFACMGFICGKKEARKKKGGKQWAN